MLACYSLLAWILLSADIDRVSAEFYIGRYKTSALGDSAAPFGHQSNKLDRPDSSRSFSSRQFAAISTFNPLTPGGTIYLAFMFLIPLTIGAVSGRSSVGKLEQILQREGKSLYNEMGYIDGNLVALKAMEELHLRGRKKRKKKK